MDILNEHIDIILLIAAVAVGMSLVSYLTKDSRNFRSRRNKKARKQF